MKQYYVIFRGYPRSQTFNSADDAVAWAKGQGIDAEYKVFIHNPREMISYIIPPRLARAEIRSMPVLSAGHTSNLIVSRKVDSTHYNVWASRMTRRDGAEFDNEVVVEARRAPGHYVVIDSYEPL